MLVCVSYLMQQIVFFHGQISKNKKQETSQHQQESTLDLGGNCMGGGCLLCDNPSCTLGLHHIRICCASVKK